MLLESPARLDVVGLIEIGADHTAAEIELALLAEAHRQAHVRPVDEIIALGDEGLVPLPVETDEGHVPPIVFRELEDRGNIDLVDVLEAFDPRLRRYHVVGMVVPVPIWR